MAMRYGMGDSDLGPVTYGEVQGTHFLGRILAGRNYSEEKARQIDITFVQKTFEKQYERALNPQKHQKKLDELARFSSKKKR